MSALANLFFRDIFGMVASGVLPQAVATGTTSGAAINLGGSADFGKLAFLFATTNASAATSVTMYLATATASGGSFTSLSATVASTTQVASSTSTTQQILLIDTRDEAFCNLGSATSGYGPLWVKPVLVVAGAAVSGALLCLGWEAGAEPAKNNDVSVNVTETDFY